MRQIWQAQLASQGRRPQVQAEMNNMAGILDSLSHTSLATILPGRAKEAEQAQQGLLWKPLSEPRVPLKVGLVFRDAQRQQASIELLRGLLEEETNLRGPVASPLDALS